MVADKMVYKTLDYCKVAIHCLWEGKKESETNW